MKKRMKFYHHRSEILARDFHRLTISSSPEIKKRIDSILIHLNIPERQWKKFDSNLTVYDFLLQLAREGHPQVNYLLDLVEEKSKLSKLGFILVGGIFLSFIIYLLTLPSFSFVLEVAQTLFASVFTIPVCGLIYSVGLSCYYFWRIYNNKRETSLNHWRDSIFQLLSSGLNVSGQLVLVISAAVASPVIGGLYVGAACVSVIKEAFCLVQEYFQYLMSPPIDENDQLNRHRAQARHQYGFQRRRNALGIDLAAALLLVVITALWCFLPGGVPATIAAYAAIGIVYLIRVALLKWNEQRLREKLQIKLAKLETSYVSCAKSNENLNENQVECTPLKRPINNYTPKAPKRSDYSSIPLKQRPSACPAAKRPFFEVGDRKESLRGKYDEEKLFNSKRRGFRYSKISPT